MSALIDWKTTALVVIDLQGWIYARPYAPNTIDVVVAQAAKLVDAFHKQDAFVALVRVSSKDGKDMPNPTLDQPAPPLNFSEGWDELVPELGATASDHIITKKQWGAFYGTDLDLQLRRRGIKTIVLCGVATGIGVDTTAREAYQRSYDQIFVIDAMSGISQREHDYTREIIFPRFGGIRTTQDILDSIEG